MLLSSFASGAGLLQIPTWLPGACAWLAGLTLAHKLTRFQVGQAVCMGGIGLAGIGFAVSQGDWSWWPAVRAGNHPLLAMLGAVTFMQLVTRAATDDKPLPRGPRAVWQTLAATHFFGAVINISAPVLIGERIAHNSRLTPLQARVVSRAFVAASMWSPFFIAMAVILDFVPNAQFGVVAGVGLLASTTLMICCAWSLSRAPDATHFVGYPLRAGALWVPALLSGLVLGGHQCLPTLPVLTLIEGAALGVVLVVLVLKRPRTAAAELYRHVTERLPGMAGEIALFLGVSVMSAGIAVAVKHSHLQLAPSTLHAGGAALLMATLTALAIIGVHPVASVAVLASLWSFEALNGNLLGIVFVLVWGLGLVASPFSGTSFVFQNRFGLRTLDLLRWNGGYVVFGCGLGVVVLYGYEAWSGLI